MKKFMKRIFYRSPELSTGTGILILLWSAGENNHTVFSDAQTFWIGVSGLALIGIGAFLGRVRGEVNRAKNR
jgi:hypothetical protein